jgi:hypothetical protein
MPPSGRPADNLSLAASAMAAAALPVLELSGPWTGICYLSGDSIGLQD